MWHNFLESTLLMIQDSTPPTPVKIDAALVRRLIAEQFPRWAHLPMRPVEHDGWDNRTFRPGEEKSVRLPSAAGYAPQMENEQRWLPFLAPHLPLPIPVPLAMGSPAQDYPWRWSVYRWIPGEITAVSRIDDLSRFTVSLAGFLKALQGIDPAGGPLQVYDAETRDALAALEGRIDTMAARAVWEAALQTEWSGPPVWVHGDMAATNLLVRQGRLSAVLDFGSMAVGDPACDLTIAWTFFTGESREAFRAALPLDASTWARARGWALWKTLITVVEHAQTNPGKAAEALGVIEALCAE